VSYQNADFWTNNETCDEHQRQGKTCSHTVSPKQMQTMSRPPNAAIMCLPSIVHPNHPKDFKRRTPLGRAKKEVVKEIRKQWYQSESLQSKTLISKEFNFTSSLMAFTVAKPILRQVPALGYWACLLDWRTQDCWFVLRTQTLSRWEYTLLRHFVTRRWSYAVVFQRRWNGIGQDLCRHLRW
jgi:hypothetical protein